MSNTAVSLSKDGNIYKLDKDTVVATHVEVQINGVVEGEGVRVLEKLGIFEFTQRKSYDEYHCAKHEVRCDVTANEFACIAAYLDTHLIPVKLANKSIFIDVKI